MFYFRKQVVHWYPLIISPLLRRRPPTYAEVAMKDAYERILDAFAEAESPEAPTATKGYDAMAVNGW